MRIRFVAMTGLAVASVLGGTLVGAADAGATTPRIGTYCTAAEALDYRYQSNGTPTVCVYMGVNGGYRWVGVAATDPVIRAPGQPCSGAYPVAVTRYGKAIMCVQGTWMVGP